MELSNVVGVLGSGSTPPSVSTTSYNNNKLSAPVAMDSSGVVTGSGGVQNCRNINNNNNVMDVGNVAAASTVNGCVGSVASGMTVGAGCGVTTSARQRQQRRTPPSTTDELGLGTGCKQQPPPSVNGWPPQGVPGLRHLAVVGSMSPGAAELSPGRQSGPSSMSDGLLVLHRHQHQQQQNGADVDAGAGPSRGVPGFAPNPLQHGHHRLTPTADAPTVPTSATADSVPHHHHLQRPHQQHQVTPAGVQSSAGRTASAVNQQRCAACGQDIADRFLLYAIDRYWHTDCLRCSACQSPLADLGSTCFTRAGMTLCRTDYIRLFGMTGTCSSCRQPIPPNEFVMRTPQDGAVYHVTCFTCVTCHGRLVPGDRYAVVNGRLVCEHDYVKAVRNHLHDQQQQQPAQDGGSGTTLRQQHHKVC